MGDILLALLVMILVLLAAYYFTKFFAGKAMGLRSGKSHMRILDRIMLSRDRYILLAEIYGKVYVLGVTGQNISLLDTLDESAILGEAGIAAPRGLESRGLAAEFLRGIKTRMGIAPVPDGEKSFAREMKTAGRNAPDENADKDGQ